MNTTIILCTYNRAQSLAKALESVAGSVMPSSARWGLLVVDNNSQDQTREVVESFCRRYPGRICYLFEAKQGKSYALNTGVEHATGDVIAFMDDDVEVDPHWLYHLTAPFVKAECGGVGGRILPEPGFKAPAWMDTKARYSMAPLAMFDLALPAGKMEEPPFGANMAYRREMFSKYGGFRTDLGPQPGGEFKNEDVEFGARVLEAGEQIWYEPAAVVYHEVPGHRVQKSYFLSWWYGKGRSDTRQENAEALRRGVLPVTLVLCRRLTIWSLRWFFTLDPARRFRSRAKVWWLGGKMRESFAKTQRVVRSEVSELQNKQ